MIRRAPRGKRPYTVIENDTLRDERLSWKARGLLAYLLSLPDNWSVLLADLVNRAPDGQSAVRSALKELEAAGYVERQRSRRDDGSFGVDSVVHERPYQEGQPLAIFAPGDAKIERPRAVTRGGKSHAKKEPLKEGTTRDAFFDAMVEVFGEASTPTRSSHYAKVARELKAAGATPKQIAQRGRVLLSRGWRDAGPGALAKHWDALAPKSASGPAHLGGWNPNDASAKARGEEARR